jgi:hypothetical protein
LLASSQKRRFREILVGIALQNPPKLGKNTSKQVMLLTKNKIQTLKNHLPHDLFESNTAHVGLDFRLRSVRGINWNVKRIEKCCAEF